MFNILQTDCSTPAHHESNFINTFRYQSPVPHFFFRCHIKFISILTVFIVKLTWNFETLEMKKK